MARHPTINQARVTLAVVAVSLVCAVAVHAQDEGRVLHEYFNPWDLGEGLEASGADGDRSGGGDGAQAPTERTSGAGQPPSLSVNPSNNEMVFGANGPVDPGATSTPYGPLNPGQQETTLDDDTDRVDRLSYYANFEPSIMPYKRGVVQNAVRVDDGEYKVRLVSTRERSVRIGGSESAGMDTFWGTFAFRTQVGRKHPLPSVAADQVILEVQSEPDVSVDIRRDEADNYYLTTRHEGLLRLNIKIGAPRFYFDGRPRTDVEWSDFDEDTTPPIPPEARDAADQVLATIGVSRSMEPRAALEEIVAWYRDFEARPFPEELRGRDLFRSVSEAQVGVCRHRSLAFMVAARSLGIPTRYVYNEAHAFVEVHWPDQGWRRIDLGGAANDFDYASRSSNSMHDASYNDEFPQPPNYVEELQRQADMQSGSEDSPASEDGREDTSDRAEAERTNREGSDESAPSADAGEPPHMEHAGQEEAASPENNDPRELERDEEGTGSESVTRTDSGSASEGASEAASEPPDPRRPVELRITAASREAFRGRAIELSGRLRNDSGEPLGGQRVEVVIGPVGADARANVIPLGTATTESDGTFEGRFSIPADVSIGRWSVMVRFRGSSEFQPATAE